MLESSSRGGVSAPGGSAPGDVSGPGGSAPGGGGIPACTEADPPMIRMTNRCKILPWPQLHCGQ